MDPKAQPTVLHDSDEEGKPPLDRDYPMDEDDSDEETTFTPASYTQHYLGSPMSWRTSSMRRHDALSQQDFPMHGASPASLTRFPGSPMSWQPSTLHTWKLAGQAASLALSADPEDRKIKEPTARASNGVEVSGGSATTSNARPTVSSLVDIPPPPPLLASPAGSTVEGQKPTSTPHLVSRTSGLTLTASAPPPTRPLALSAPRPMTIPAAAELFHCPKTNCIWTCSDKNKMVLHVASGTCKLARSAAPTEAERQGALLFACGVGKCTKKFSHPAHLSYHYQTSDHSEDPHLTPSTNTNLESKPIVDSVIEPIDLTGKVASESEFAKHGGSYADIYIGQCTTKDEMPSKVAIKVIRAHIYKDADRDKLQKRLTREIRIWACLMHPNVLPLLGTVTNFGSGVLSMVCPWMEEGDLAGYLVRMEDHLTRRTRLNLCQDITNGLNYIHSRQVVHRDLTTANILIGNGNAKLSDFGLSNVIAELQGPSFMTSKTAGSARWAAPELFPPDDSAPPEPNFSTDIYSLGSVIFNVMSGKLPYEGMTETQVMLQVMSGRLPTPATFKMDSTDSSDGFWHIIKRCWETVPPSRPTVGEVGQMIALLHLR